MSIEITVSVGQKTGTFWSALPFPSDCYIARIIVTSLNAKLMNEQKEMALNIKWICCLSASWFLKISEVPSFEPLPLLSKLLPDCWLKIELYTSNELLIRVMWNKITAIARGVMLCNSTTEHRSALIFLDSKWFGAWWFQSLVSLLMGESALFRWKQIFWLFNVKF